MVDWDETKPWGVPVPPQDPADCAAWPAEGGEPSATRKTALIVPVLSLILLAAVSWKIGAGFADRGGEASRTLSEACAATAGGAIRAAAFVVTASASPRGPVCTDGATSQPRHPEAGVRRLERYLDAYIAFLHVGPSLSEIRRHWRSARRMFPDDGRFTWETAKALFRQGNRSALRELLRMAEEEEAERAR